jgi:hypothetical protein
MSNYRVQFKATRVQGDRWKTAAVCETKEHADFVANGLRENQSLQVRVESPKSPAKSNPQMAVCKVCGNHAWQCNCR